MHKQRSWSEISGLGLKISDAMIDCCDQLADPLGTQRGSLSDSSVFNLMNEFLTELSDSPTKQAIVRKWNEFRSTRNQQDSIALKVQVGVDFANWLRKEFDTNEARKLVQDARRSSTEKEDLPKQPAVRTGNHDRDQWLYEQKISGLSTTEIRQAFRKLEPQCDWDIPETDPGVDKAIKEHAKRHGLPLPTPRKLKRRP